MKQNGNSAQTKKILLIDPYLDALGGGEEHILSIIKVFNEKGYAIHLAWNEAGIISKIENRFQLLLTNIQILPDFHVLTPLKRLLKTLEYDVLFYVTDGSYFFSLARKNYIFTMYPKRELYTDIPLNRIKWFNFQFIANSNYTKNRVDIWTKQNSTVIYPYLRSDYLLPRYPAKKKQIVSVGRFFGHLHSKRQDILVDAFNKFSETEEGKGFKLILIGGLKKEDKKYFKKVEKKAEGNKNIQLIPNASQEELLQTIKESMFYWHGAGYDVDEILYPDKVEHLGIAPLQGMAMGCVTCAYNAGGQKEIIEQGKNGFLYSSITQLVAITRRIVSNPQKAKKIALYAMEYAKTHFNYEQFKNNVFNVCQP